MLACFIAPKMLSEFTAFDLKNGGEMSYDGCRYLNR